MIKSKERKKKENTIKTREMIYKIQKAKERKKIRMKKERKKHEKTRETIYLKRK